MNTYELTKYPKVFKFSYWGAFDSIKNKDTCARGDIISNRNDFVEQWDIKKAYETKSILELCNIFSNYHQYGEQNEFDHIETYQSKLGEIIIIASPYANNICDLAIKIGFKKYIPLYAPSATTFLACFNNLKQVGESLKFVKQEVKNHRIKLLLSIK